MRSTLARRLISDSLMPCCAAAWNSPWMRRACARSSSRVCFHAAPSVVMALRSCSAVSCMGSLVVCGWLVYLSRSVSGASLVWC